MKLSVTPIPILIADDDPEDRVLAREALVESRLGNPLFFVEDGEDLLAFLRHEGRYADRDAFPEPGLILLDLNMPRMSGFEALQEIRADESLRHIPVVALTTSSAMTDVTRSYHLGVNSYITKPVTFDGLVDAMKLLGRYWFDLVEIPANADE